MVVQGEGKEMQSGSLFRLFRREGDLLAHFPCIRPADLITAMRDIGHLDKVAGLPMDTCSSQMINEQRVYSNLFFQYSFGVSGGQIQ